MRLSGDVPAGGQIVFLRKNGQAMPPVSYMALGDGWIRIEGGTKGEIDYGSYYSDRSRYVVVEGEIIRHIVKVIGVRPRGIGDNGAPMYGIDGVVDVPEVHTADLGFFEEPEPEPEPEPPPAPPTPPTPPPDVPPAPVIPVVSLNKKITFLTAYAGYGSGYPATILLKSNGELWGHWYQVGQEIISPAPVVADRDNGGGNTYALYSNPVEWLTPPTENYGVNFEARISFKAEDITYRNGVTASQIPRELVESFMWLDASPPSNNYIFNGTRLYKERSGITNNRLYVSDWISLGSDVEFRGLIRSFGMYKPPDSFIPFQVDPFRIRGNLAIRDKASGVVQTIVDIELGFFTDVR